MRLRIQHVTSYIYARPVTFKRHRLVLRPRESHEQRLERMTLRLEPEYRIRWVRDVFGNSIALVDFTEPSERLTIVNDFVVERQGSFPTRELHDPWRVAFPPQYDPFETAITAAYQAPAFLEDAPAVQAWLRDQLAPDANDAEGTMLALCELVGRAIGYRRREEKGVQSPAKTLELKTGSCRDMATLMMEAARLLGVAARFASGYLHCTASRRGHASTHAWTEVYLPTLGWRGFDPTTRAMVGINHIVTGVSTHPRGVMPVSGSFVGTSSDYRALEVTVKTEEIVEAEGPAAPPVVSTSIETERS